MVSCSMNVVLTSTLHSRPVKAIYGNCTTSLEETSWGTDMAWLWWSFLTIMSAGLSI